MALPTVGLHDNIDEQEYHRDPLSLSSSSAKTLIFDGPDVLQSERHEIAVYRDAFDFGSVVHALVLGVGEYEVLEYDSWRSKQAKVDRVVARAQGKAPILRKDFERAEAMRDSVMAHPLASYFLSEGRPEVSFWATDPETGVLMRGRADWLRNFVVDLKTTGSSADQAGFVKSVWSYHYHFQFAYYERILELNDVEVGVPHWIAVSKRAPYETGVFHPDERSMERARADVRRALRLYAHCTSTGTWPALHEAYGLEGVGAPARGSRIPYLESVSPARVDTNLDWLYAV